MKNYTNDFSQFYRDLYKEQILIESCSKLFKTEIEAECFRFKNQVLPNLFETDQGWLINNSI
ncbi:MAG: hypothetical protein KBS93_00625, partial [Flavobacteriaceae bacterium]|nr:hypothetical protein [Candidatus Onthonaster equi]